MDLVSWSTSTHESFSQRSNIVFLVTSGSQGRTRNGSSSSPSLVLDSGRGGLVEHTVRMQPKGVSVERSVAALKNHSEAERNRRARINAHLDTLRGIVPGARKMDKASLFAKVISHLKELRKNAEEVSEGFLIPMDIDQVIIEPQKDGLDGAPYSIKATLSCDYKPRFLSDLRQALEALHLIIIRAEIATLGGRMKNVFVMASCKEGVTENSEVRLLASSIEHVFHSVLDKFYASDEFSLQTTLNVS